MRKNVTELQLLFVHHCNTEGEHLTDYTTENSMIHEYHRALSNKQLPSYRVTVFLNDTHSFYGLITQDNSKAKTC